MGILIVDNIISKLSFRELKEFFDIGYRLRDTLSEYVPTLRRYSRISIDLRNSFWDHYFRKLQSCFFDIVIC